MLRKRVGISLVLLVVLLLILNSSSFWKIIYPIAYEDYIRDASNHFEVNPFLVLAIVQTESKFEHERFSHKGARGLMQLMPETAEWANRQSGLARESTDYVEQPEYNILLGTWYLSYLLTKYDGDYIKTIAAYNAGEGRVDRWLASGIWNGTKEQIMDIPIGETRHYLTRVLYYYERYTTIYQDEFTIPPKDASNF